jgi:phage tail-like protein
MARTQLNDYLLTHQFHLLDVDFSMAVPPWVLWPAAGFSAITMPELSIETEEIREGTSDFVYKVLKQGTTNTITLSKGASAFNSDFWRWTMACLSGRPTKESFGEFLAELGKSAAFLGSTGAPGKRRNMALMHLSGISPKGVALAAAQGGPLDKIKAAAVAPALGVTAAVDVVKNATRGLVDFGISSIPAKVFMLFDCLPVRYKPGSDFDAATSAVSVEELEIAYTRFEEFALLA